MNAGSVTRFSKPDREQAARREITLTRVSRTTGRILIMLFLITITAVPVLQTAMDYRRLGGRVEKLRLADVPGAIRQALLRLADAPEQGFVTACGEANHAMKSGFHDFEKALEKESFLSAALIPRWQTVASGFLGVGNEKVFLGKEGWLYYRPDLDYLAGPPFPVSSEGISTLSRGGRVANPLPALESLARDLSARGIRLIVVPIPVKPMIEPEHLTGRVGELSDDLQNPSFSVFVARLRGLGITVIDPADLLRQAKRRAGAAQYLRTDTHWTPQAMECVAERVAGVVSTMIPPGGVWVSGAPEVPMSVTNRGDLAEMLDLPQDSQQFGPETVTLLSSAGSDEKAGKSSPVLLLGDSFTRIYSSPDLHWGSGSGLAERLSSKLGQSVDVIAINAGGSSAVRQELARSPGKLTGKSVVVYEFSMRELTSGDWKVIPIPSLPEGKTPFDGKSSLTVTGTIAEISAMPDPGTSPYRDFLRSARLTGVSGVPPGVPDLLVFFQALRDRKPTAASGLREGQKVTFHLIPWSAVEGRLGSLNRSELQGDAADLPDVYWCGDY